MIRLKVLGAVVGLELGGGGWEAEKRILKEGGRLNLAGSEELK